MAKYYIDREALIEWLKRIPLKDLSDGLGLCRVIFEDDFKKAIKKMPKGIIVDVSPVQHGHWNAINQIATGLPWKYRCNDCGCPQEYTHNYCPNCGARMDKETKK